MAGKFALISDLTFHTNFRNLDLSWGRDPEARVGFKLHSYFVVYRDMQITCVIHLYPFTISHLLNVELVGLLVG